MKRNVKTGEVMLSPDELSTAVLVFLAAAPLVESMPETAALWQQMIKAEMLNHAMTQPPALILPTPSTPLKETATDGPITQDDPATSTAVRYAIIDPGDLPNPGDLGLA